jgi:type II secretory pathway predicted ATPase ExeA
LRSAVSPDPFELEPSTAFYVPRRATVQALAGLQTAIEQDEPLVLLRGPAGIGKTLLLRLLRRRVDGRMRCIDLLASGRDAAALCAAALQALGREPGSAPAAELARAASELERQRAEGSRALRGGILLLIDGGETISGETLRSLLELALHGTALQVVLAAELSDGGPAWVRSLDPRIALVELVQPMSVRETIEYLQARLDLAVASPELRRRLGWRSWPRLIPASRGNPALLHHLVHVELAGDGTVEVPARLVPPAPRRAGFWRWLTLGSSALLLLAFALFALRAREPAAPLAPPPAEPPTASQAPQRSAGPAAPRPPALPTQESVDLPETAAASSAPAPATPPLPAAEPVPAAPAPVDAAPPPAPVAPAPAVAPPPARTAAPRPSHPPRAVEPRAIEQPPRPEPVATAPPEVRIPVFVNAVPPARIEIDGRDVGPTPIAGLLVPAGTRRIAALFPDGRRIERSIEVEGAEVYVLFP